eukprot:scaffold28743_cov43-Phaeocystis_antarctica.AAC.1
MLSFARRLPGLILSPIQRFAKRRIIWIATTRRRKALPIDSSVVKLPSEAASKMIRHRCYRSVGNWHSVRRRVIKYGMRRRVEPVPVTKRIEPQANGSMRWLRRRGGLLIARLRVARARIARLGRVRRLRLRHWPRRTIRRVAWGRRTIAFARSARPTCSRLRPGLRR